MNDAWRSFLHGSLVALLTPMHVDGSIDETAFIGLIERQIAARTRAVVVASTTGEAATLSFDEHIRLYRSAVSHAAGRIAVIGGIGSPSTQVACELAVHASHAGVDAVLCVTPYYNRPNREGLLRHFSKVADAANVPVILYDVPHRTGVHLPDDLIADLSAHPLIVGLKDATGDASRPARLLPRVAAGFALLSGDDWTALELMGAGAVGVVSVAANVAPLAMQAMCDAFERGDLASANALDGQLGPLYALLGADTNPVPAKCVAHELGLMQNHVRLPLIVSQSLSRRVAAGLALPALRQLLIGF